MYVGSTVMITGDNRDTACAIAFELGFFTEQSNIALSGQVILVSIYHSQGKLTTFWFAVLDE